MNKKNVNSKTINSKKWIKISTTTALIGFSLLMLTNYIVDPFNVFQSKILKHDFQINQRYIKIEYLEKNKEKYNGYMIGSSRIGTTNPKVVEHYIPGAKIYNMTLNGANLYSNLMHIRYMIKAKYPIKTLYMQLDGINMSYYGSDESNYLGRMHPYVKDESLALFYFDYLSGFFPLNIKKKIAQNFNYTFNVTYDLQTGIWANPVAEEKIAKNCEEYVKNQKSFHRHNRPVLKYTTRKETIHALKEIVSLCKANNIKLYTFMVPHNKILMDTFVIKDYLAYLKDIANITNFYDFSGYNSITTNNCNYYERSHYRPFIGKLIAARIFNDKTVNIPNDFGQLVTKENITEHLQMLKENIINYKKGTQKNEKDSIQTE